MKNRLLFLLVPALLWASPGCEQHAHRQHIADPPVSEIWLWQDQIAAAKLIVEPLAPQPVGGLVVTSGRVTFDDLKVAHVMSPVTGRVSRIEAQPGQRVKKGDTLDTLAKRFNVSTRLISTWNNLKNKVALKPGRRIIIAKFTEKNGAMAPSVEKS